MFDVAYAMGGAGTGTGAAGNGFMSFLPFIAIIVVFYFLLIRPQQKKAKQQREMLAGIKKGDHVITTGGLYGEVTGLTENTVTMEIAPKVRVKFARGSIAAITKKEENQ
ncbi:MAG: preprotein translocase subunit YajC [Desulfobacteraceae bacterium]|nr:MAG: preprotein translocase subunit YajC [Desulfobacteraceae bacterium]